MINYFLALNKMKLRAIKIEDFTAIYRLTKNEDVMQYVGNGRPWSHEKVYNFIDYNLEEQEMNNQGRKNFYYVVEEGKNFIGIIGFHLMRKKYVLTVFFYKSKQNKGAFSPALELLKKKIKKAKPNLTHIYAQVHIHNDKMLALSEAKFVDNGYSIVGGKEVREFIINLDKYSFFNDGDNMIIKLLEKRGNWEIIEDKKKLDFLYLEGPAMYDKKYYHYNTLLRNNNDNHQYFTMKNKLYHTLRGSKYLLENYDINDKILEEKIDGSTIWIIKPVQGYAGAGIIISKDKKDIQKHIKKFKKYSQWVLQKYIENPLLYENRKFHFRIYMLVHNDKFYYYQKGLVALANKIFTLTAFEDKDIHDTRFKDQVLLFPDIFETDLVDKIYVSIEEIIRELKSNKIKCFPDSKYCYQIFAMDLMILDNLDIKLLEINEKVSQKFIQPDFKKAFLESQIQTVVDSYFPPKITSKDKNYFVEVV